MKSLSRLPSTETFLLILIFQKYTFRANFINLILVAPAQFQHPLQ